MSLAYPFFQQAQCLPLAVRAHVGDLMPTERVLEIVACRARSLHVERPW